LTLEPNASLVVNSNINVSCITKIATGAAIRLGNQAIVQFGSDVVNKGSISLNQSKGTLVCSGEGVTQKFSGAGTTRVHRLENKQISDGNILNLESPLQVTGFVEVSKGILNSNGNLTLLSNSEGSATLLPVLNLNSARVIGNVNVQTYISGDYPSPRYCKRLAVAIIACVH